MTQSMLDTAMRLQAFAQPHVRALAWCLLGPRLQLPRNLTAPALAFSFDVDSDWLQWQNNHSDALSQYISKARSPRLGIYYEQLWRFVFEHHPGFELLAHDQQIQHQGKTLGAMDFLVRYRHQVFHIETAVKFYLAEQHAPEPEQWLGPNCNDRLHTKLQRMNSHQLALSKHPAAQTWLHSLDIAPASIHTRQIIQGFLFEPALQVSTNDPIGLSIKRNDKKNWSALQNRAENKRQDKARLKLSDVQKTPTRWQYWRHNEFLGALTAATTATCTSTCTSTSTPIMEAPDSRNDQVNNHASNHASNQGAPRWLILPKSLWLTPYVSSPQKQPTHSNGLAEPLSSENLLHAIKAHFTRPSDAESKTRSNATSTQHQRPVLIAEVTEYQGAILELRRFFVVPDHWPW